MSENEKSISRRKFLQIVGTASAVGAVGCADSPAQKVLPYVKGDDEQLPGVAVWYNSTCTECSAGCGIQVRTREGRAVKLEGNPENPINRGGLCAIGQSAVQHLYDPDRIRQPLKKINGNFTPISWDEAYAEVSAALAGAKNKALISGAVTGALQELLSEWVGAAKTQHVVHEVWDHTAHAKASELVYGSYGIPEYKFDRAAVILNFGADFLESWISPCGYARDWAKGRKAGKLSKFIHVEPRLSLTGANADLWISAKPGTEVLLARAILKIVLESGAGQNLSDAVRGQLVAITRNLSLDQVAADTNISKEKILLIAEELKNAEASMVIAGGSAAATENGLTLQMLTACLNLTLANVGKTVLLGSMRKPQASVAKMKTLIDSMKQGQIDLLMLSGVNPLFTMPLSFGFSYAVKNVPTIISFSSHLDETTKLANLILPVHTSLESFGDVRVQPGVYGLLQPVMQPVFETQAFGDILLKLAKDKSFAGACGTHETFESYLKSSWQKLKSQLGVTDDFDKFWLASLERGGYFETQNKTAPVKVKVDLAAISQSLSSAEFDRKGLTENDLVLMPYPSVKSFDGSSANRPWLQELPDPISQAVWDTWAEIHPETAKAKGLEQGDVATLRTEYGELNVPVFITEYVRRDVVAVPIGQGHSDYGRFANTVGGGNVFQLLPAVIGKGTDGIALLSTRVSVQRGRGAGKLVLVQGEARGSNSDHRRGIAKTTIVSAGAAKAAASNAHALDQHDLHTSHAEEHHATENAAHGHGGHGENVKQMYDQRKHPLYRWALSVDLAACTGCSACVVACYAENNIPMVGKRVVGQGREMAWLRIERYYEGPAEELRVSFVPMMCQHCGNAPCEPVCPVYATYHNEEGLNQMVYNRCVGTRYCGNNCSYKVRRFNFFEFAWPEPLNWQLNPDVVKRSVGVMEKCTFCVQRIVEGKEHAKDQGRTVQDGEVQPACVQSCPTQALTFGNLNDPESRVSKLAKDQRAYKVLDPFINTQPAVSYLEDLKHKLI